jgi:hypothetical protein
MNVLQEGGFRAPLLQDGPDPHPPLQATQLLPFHTSGIVHELQEGGFRAPLLQDGPDPHPPLQATQLLPFHTSGIVHELQEGGFRAPLLQVCGSATVIVIDWKAGVWVLLLLLAMHVGLGVVPEQVHVTELPAEGNDVLLGEPLEH